MPVSNVPNIQTDNKHTGKIKYIKDTTIVNYLYFTNTSLHLHSSLKGSSKVAIYNTDLDLPVMVRPSSLYVALVLHSIPNDDISLDTPYVHIYN